MTDSSKSALALATAAFFYFFCLIRDALSVKRLKFDTFILVLAKNDLIILKK